uniref:Fusion protein n=1 Tax=Rubber dandelion latent virus 2 TaxID=2175278 RepID=A0A2S1PH12_9VIRU|nr:fusion protein [Rubber dandelion latent virus 2]
MEFVLEKTPAEEQAMLVEKAAPLIAFHFPASIFTRDAAIDAGYTFKSFLKHVTSVARYAESDQLRAICRLGIKHDIFELHQECSIDQFVRFSDFLKSKEGQAALQGVAIQTKLQKRAGTTFTPKDVALEQIFSIMRQDFHAAMKEEGAAFQKVLAELRLQIKKVEKEWEDRQAEIRAAFNPVSVYQEPSEKDIGVEAYAAYEKEAGLKNMVAKPKASGGLEYAIQNYGPQISRTRVVEFANLPEHHEGFFGYMKQRVLQFVPSSTPSRKRHSSISWLPRVEEKLLSLPKTRRWALSSMCPVGLPPTPELRPSCFPLSDLISEEVMNRKAQVGVRVGNRLVKGLRQGRSIAKTLASTRIQVLQPIREVKMRAIPTARSKWESALRRIIGGGSMRSWQKDSDMMRGGGDVADAVLLLGTAVDESPERLLRGLFSPEFARKVLLLPSGLEVPDGLEMCRMKNFNEEATAGPFLRAFGVKGKYGLKGVLEEEMWWYYDAFARGELTPEQMPHFGARVGFRSKLLAGKKFNEKVAAGEPLGRAVMMLDALEQAASSPLYNVISAYTSRRRLEAACGFKNGVIKASSDWPKVWEEVKKAQVIVELDWKKFDRERPAEDIDFIIDVVIGCFSPQSSRERRLLEGYRLMMRRALVERLVIMDDGGVFGIDGMVPSGSLWTGWLDTALNILYIRAACVEAGCAPLSFSPMCAGDDNLTLFYSDREDSVLLRIKGLLNRWFRAGIGDDDFIIHRPPFHVIKQQAVFPPGTDLSHGTSAIIHLAKWVEFDGELEIDLDSGKSHRWEYVFKGKPKFLSNYWLLEGQPIRPTTDNLEKLLWPEGIHDDLDDYQAALTAMVVDNVWNHHLVNHMMMRYVIIQQLRRMMFIRGADDDICFWATLREKGGGVIPYPQVAPWRRGSSQKRMEDYPETRSWIEDFSSFVQGVTSLYSRDCEGGIDSWQFMKIIRCEGHVGEGQYGNDLTRWLTFLSENPCTKYLKAVRGLRRGPVAKVGEPEHLQAVGDAFGVLREALLSGRMEGEGSFAIWVSDRLIGNNVNV